MKDSILKTWATDNGLKPASVVMNLKRKGFPVNQRTMMTDDLVEAYNKRKGKSNGVSKENRADLIATWKPEKKEENTTFEKANIIPEDDTEKAEPELEKNIPTKFVGGKRVVDEKALRKMQMQADTGNDQLSRNEQIAMQIFTNPLVSILMVCVVLAADGVSSAYLADLVFNDIWVKRAFFMVGVAVGYIAIRAVIRYESDGLASGFFFVQLLLHLSAFGVFDHGLTIGQRVGLSIIAVAISLSSVGFSLSMRDIVNK